MLHNSRRILRALLMIRGRIVPQPQGIAEPLRPRLCIILIRERPCLGISAGRL